MFFINNFKRKVTINISSVCLDGTAFFIYFRHRYSMYRFAVVIGNLSLYGYCLALCPANDT